jgi:hypothetical protein
MFSYKEDGKNLKQLDAKSYRILNRLRKRLGTKSIKEELEQS